MKDNQLPNANHFYKFIFIHNLWNWFHIQSEKWLHQNPNLNLTYPTADAFTCGAKNRHRPDVDKPHACSQIWCTLEMMQPLLQNLCMIHKTFWWMWKTYKWNIVIQICRIIPGRLQLVCTKSCTSKQSSPAYHTYRSSATQLFPLSAPLPGWDSGFSNPGSDHLNDCQSLPGAHTPVFAAGQLLHSVSSFLEICCNITR